MEDLSILEKKMGNADKVGRCLVEQEAWGARVLSVSLDLSPPAV